MSFSFTIQVLTMKILDMVNLIEVIDDPDTDHFYMGIYFHSFFCFVFNAQRHFDIFAWSCHHDFAYEWIFLSAFRLTLYLTANLFLLVLDYVDDKWVSEGSGPPAGLKEDIAWKYLRDIVLGLMYLHAHVWSWKYGFA